MEIASARETFTIYLREKKLRATKERNLLIDAIMRTNSHFDADELYSLLKSNRRKVSRATVYNTLDLLTECGLISRYRFDENHARFEKAFGRPRHHHLICVKCGSIIEFVNESLEKVEKKVCEERKFERHTMMLQIFGLCSNCQTHKS